MGKDVSLCMIVRDEEGGLGRCLRSVQGCVAQIVVVDTGSTDATAAVAKSFDARVVSARWQDDFSLARNRSLAEAGGDWILVLDADEELPPDSARELARLVERDDVEAWTVTVASPAAGGVTRHAALRLFRNRKAYRFEGVVHEQIQPSILRADPAAVIRHANLEIRHYGYLPAERKEKTARNIRLLQKALAAEPFDPYLNYNLGVSYLAAGDPEKARPPFEVALLGADKGSGYAAALYRNYALCLNELGEYAPGLRLLDEGLGHFPAYPDLHFLKGQLFLEVGLLAQARACFLTCTSFRYVPPEYVTMDGVTSHLSQENLAEIALREGDAGLAADYLAAVYRTRESYAVLRRLGLVLRGQGLAGRRLAQALQERLDAAGPELARVLFDLGEYGACLFHLGGESEPADLLLAVRCLSRTGRPAEARRLLESGAAGGGDGQRAVEQWLAERLQGGSDPPPAGREEEAAAAAAEAAYAAWSRGEEETALVLAGSPLVLARQALARGRPADVEALLADAGDGPAAFLRGRAAGERGLHREACEHFLQAAAASGDPACYRQALAEAIDQTRHLVLELLKVEGQNGALQMELFRLAQRRTKLARGRGEATGAGL